MPLTPWLDAAATSALRSWRAAAASRSRLPPGVHCGPCDVGKRCWVLALLGKRTLIPGGEDQRPKLRHAAGRVCRPSPRGTGGGVAQDYVTPRKNHVLTFCANGALTLSRPAMIWPNWRLMRCAGLCLTEIGRLAGPTTCLVYQETLLTELGRSPIQRRKAREGLVTSL
jgi:hypothetical protein